VTLNLSGGGRINVRPERSKAARRSEERGPKPSEAAKRNKVEAGTQELEEGKTKPQGKVEPTPDREKKEPRGTGIKRSVTITVTWRQAEASATTGRTGIDLRRLVPVVFYASHMES
jgi:hypothetical protein